VARKIARPALRPVTILLREVQGAARQAMEEALRDAGLTVSQANVLVELAYGKARSNAELARIQSVTPQTMVEILVSLERRGLISRMTRPEGGRSMPAELTREGHSSVFTVHRAMRSVENRLLGTLSQEDVSRLRRLLEECLVALERNDLQGRAD
jgi:DNA-binding MarR family transcriptional regulator